MTTSRTAAVVALLLLTSGFGVWSQQVPTTWTWATRPLVDLSPSQSSGGWDVTLPKLLAKGWEQLVDHQVTLHEQSVFSQNQDTAKTLDLKRQRDQKLLERSRLWLGPDADPKALLILDEAVKELDDKLAAQAPTTPAVDAVAGKPLPRIPLKMVEDAQGSSAVTSVQYEISGTLRTLAGYLQVVVSLKSHVEDRELVRWEGTFAPEEAATQMQLARQKFLEVMLGRPWSGLSITSEVAGTVVDLGAKGRRSVPWQGEDFEPGPLRLSIYRPGRTVETLDTDLEPLKVTEVALKSPSVAGETIRLVTSPPDASVWLDSRWLGHSPLEFEVPLQLSRLRYQLDGYASGVVEIRPDSPRVLDLQLTLPGPLADATSRRDTFYWSLAALTASSTTTFFLRDGADQQLRLANAYAKSGNAANYAAAVEVLNVLWYGSQASIALTTGVFVWMMFTLGDYLSAAQAQLP